LADTSVKVALEAGAQAHAESVYSMTARRSHENLQLKIIFEDITPLEILLY
jgi:hypothetical protein